MNNLEKLIIALVLMTFASCSPMYYGPSTMNLPALDQAGQLQIAASSSTSRSTVAPIAIDGSSTDFTVAYSPKQNITLTTGVTAFSHTGLDNSIGISASQLTLANLGVGYYKPLGEDLLWESYLDVNLGKFKGHDYETQKTASTAFVSKIGLKSGLWFKTNVISLGLGYGLYNLSYSNIRGEAYLANDYLENHSSSMLSEMSGTLRVGNDKISAQYQIGRSYNLTHRDFYQTNKYGSLGLTVNFDLRNSKI